MRSGEKWNGTNEVNGGIIMFDDYGTFPGETKAVDEFFADKGLIIEKLPMSHIPSFIIKK